MALNMDPMGGGNDSSRLRQLEYILGNIQREVDGMRRERITGLDGQQYEVLGRRGMIVEPDTVDLPFGVNLTKRGDQYFVTVNDGRVVERAMSVASEADALYYYECSNRADGNGTPIEFRISVNEAVYVQVKEDSSGRVDSEEEIIIVIEDNYLRSQNYVPDGQEGIYYYKLATLIQEGTVAKLDPVCAGSHIYHKTGLTCDVRILQCPDPMSSSEGAQLLRVSFISGTVAFLNKSKEERPLAPNKAETNVEHCT
jgi:hypothetical protein